MNKAQEGAARGGDPKPKRGGKKPPAQNPIEAAVSTWLRSPPLAERGRQPDHEQLLAQTPKRWTVYEPMVLLPAGAFGSPAWRQVLDTSPSPGPEDGEGNGEARKRASVVADQLWKRILFEISKRHGAARLTHLAVNEGIPLHHITSSVTVGDSGKGEDEGEQNILRSPSGLRILHGDFGPAALLVGGGTPSSADFERAFWASTKQNGIFQTWAPRWTMFSRGNVKEKARLLGFHGGGDARRAPSLSPSPSPSPSPSQSQSQSPREQGERRRAAARTTRLATAHAVDLYAGIGYFAFSYARLGMRVLCWELNPWSVEGLRRGARGNGWSVRVVRGDELLFSSMAELLAGREQIVVFQEDNARAAARIAEVRRLQRGGGDSDLDVLHVNCGLLPISDASWRGAWDIVVGGVGEAEAWLHLHENVGVADIEGRRGEIERWFGELAEKESGKARRNDGSGSSQQWTLVVYVDHVERVKTFAPGVWHCVFDLYIAKKNITT